MPIKSALSILTPSVSEIQDIAYWESIMKGLGITYRNLEEYSALEVKELIGASCSVEPTTVIFSIKSYTDLCRLCYSAQSLIRVLCLIDEFSFSGEEELFSRISRFETGEFIRKDTKFAVRVKIVNNDMLISEEIAAKAAENINGQVDLKNPEITFLLYIYEKKAYFGIDFAGVDLSKRDYKVFSIPGDLKAPIAYLLLRMAGYDEKKVLLDPFCGSGLFAIEGVLFAKSFSANYYSKDKFAFLNFHFLDTDCEKLFEGIDCKADRKKELGIYCYDPLMRGLSASNKNAKVAGVLDSIHFSRIETRNLDLKFEDESVDIIISKVISPSKAVNFSTAKKIYDLLFHTAGIILKKTGTLLLVTYDAELLIECAQQNGFKLKEQRKTMQGEQELNIVLFSK